MPWQYWFQDTKESPLLVVKTPLWYLNSDLEHFLPRNTVFWVYTVYRLFKLCFQHRFFSFWLTKLMCTYPTFSGYEQIRMHWLSMYLGSKEVGWQAQISRLDPQHHKGSAWGMCFPLIEFCLNYILHRALKSCQSSQHGWW